MQKTSYMDARQIRTTSVNRIDDDKKESHGSFVDLRRLLADCLSDSAEIAAHNQLQIFVDVNINSTCFSRSLPALKLVVSNLIHKTVTISPHGGVVSIIGKLIGNEIVIRIIDQGPSQIDSESTLDAEPCPKLKQLCRNVGRPNLTISDCNQIFQTHGGKIQRIDMPLMGNVWELILPVVRA